VQTRTCLLRLLPLLEQAAQLLTLRPPLHPRRVRRCDRLGAFDDRGALRERRGPSLLPLGTDLSTAVLGVLLQLTEPSPQGVQVTDGRRFRQRLGEGAQRAVDVLDGQLCEPGAEQLDLR